MTSNKRHPLWIAALAATLGLGFVAGAQAEGTFFKKKRATAPVTAVTPEPKPQTPPPPAPEPEQPTPEPPAPKPEIPAPTPISGVVDSVESTDTLIVAGQRVQLAGIRGEAALTQGLTRWLAGNGNQVNCEPIAARYVCKIPRGTDVGLIVLSNGAGRADAEASEEYKQAEGQARAQRRGVWAN